MADIGCFRIQDYCFDVGDVFVGEGDMEGVTQGGWVGSFMDYQAP